MARGQQGLRWGIALAAVLALLQPALVTFDIDLSGWRADHGHLFGSSATGAVPDHAHPYDEGYAHDHGENGDSASADAVSESDVVFVSGDDVTSNAMPAATRVVLTPPLASTDGQIVLAAEAPSDVAIQPPAPPPRV